MQQTKPTNQPQAASPSLLWIDDDEDFVLAMECRLSEISLVHAASPEQALQAVAKCSFPVIVSDYTFNHQKSGVALLRQLQDLQPQAKRYLLTAQILSPDEKSHLAAEGIAALEKLYDLEQLLAELQLHYCSATDQQD